MRIDRSHCYIPELLIASACKSTRYDFRTKNFDSHPYRVQIELRIHFLAIAVFRLIDAVYHLLWAGMYFVLRSFTFIFKSKYQEEITDCMKKNLHFSKKQMGIVIKEIKDGVFLDPEKSLREDLLRLRKPVSKPSSPLKRRSIKRKSNPPNPPATSSASSTFQIFKRRFRRS